MVFINTFLSKDYIFKYAFILLLYGCSPFVGHDEEVIGVNLEVISGNNQVALQNSQLPESVVIIAKDTEGVGVTGVNLQIEVASGGGMVIGSSIMVTDDQGIINVSWELGDKYNNTLKVFSSSNESSFVLLNAQAKYKYKIPEVVNDGWGVQSINEILNNFQSVYDGLDEIRKGNYEEIHSMLLAIDNNLVFEEYFKGVNSFGQLIDYNMTTLHELQSVNKSFRGAMVGIAIDKGFIDNDQVPLYNFFPDLDYLSKNGKEDILLEHFLGMSSGLEWDESKDLAGFYGNSFDNAHTYVLSKPLKSTPGTVFEYNTGASFVLNKIIINSINIGFEEFARNNYSVLIESNALPGTGRPLDFRNTPRDMLKLGQVYLNDGKWKNTQVISQAWVDKSTQVHINASATNSYGYQWWIREFNIGSNTYNCFYAAGFGGQYIFVIKELNLVAVFTGGNFNSNSPPIEIMEDYILTAFE
jgi:CubicO group peptidase (beta-lactamase class C family)